MFLESESTEDLDSAHSADERKTLKLDINLIKASVSLSMGVPVDQLAARRRVNERATFARQIAMYIAHVSFGAHYDSVGTAFNRNRTTVHHACQRVEDRRDRHEIDFIITCIERSVEEMHGLAGDKRT